ncbi:hypothetical protein ATANTOWER_020305 [Ataeniobius toweri]|uniref:Uncharacterized protein n=1 Tax=Ataeniobius toweri TaxID=208326 RepID=A0ABU7CHU9_9TELE|nr:hypothetical protein [Ataeniobius toweri]
MVYGVRTFLQQSTLTYLPASDIPPPLTSPPGRKNNKLITNKHHSPPPADLSLCGYTHVPPLELHHLSSSKPAIPSTVSQPYSTSYKYNLPSNLEEFVSSGPKASARVHQ